MGKEEYESLSGGKDVYEQGSGGWTEKESVPEAIPEDTVYRFLDSSDDKSMAKNAEAEKFMAENPELFNDYSSVPPDVFYEQQSAEASDSVHNEDSEHFTIGRYSDDDNNYIDVARRDGSAHFSMSDDEWAETQGKGLDDPDRLTPYSNEEMFEPSGNQEFMENMIDEGKDIHLSHSPKAFKEENNSNGDSQVSAIEEGDLGGNFEKEMDHFTDRTGETSVDFEEKEDGTYGLSDPAGYRSRFDEGEAPWTGENDEGKAFDPAAEDAATYDAPIVEEPIDISPVDISPMEDIGGDIGGDVGVDIGGDFGGD